MKRKSAYQRGYEQGRFDVIMDTLIMWKVTPQYVKRKRVEVS